MSYGRVWVMRELTVEKSITAGRISTRGLNYTPHTGNSIVVVTGFSARLGIGIVQHIGNMGQQRLYRRSDLCDCMSPDQTRSSRNRNPIGKHWVCIACMMRGMVLYSIVRLFWLFSINSGSSRVPFPDSRALGGHGTVKRTDHPMWRKPVPLRTQACESCYRYSQPIPEPSCSSRGEKPVVVPYCYCRSGVVKISDGRLTNSGASAVITLCIFRQTKQKSKTKELT